MAEYFDGNAVDTKIQRTHAPIEQMKMPNLMGSIFNVDR